MLGFGDWFCGGSVMSDESQERLDRAVAVLTGKAAVRAVRHTPQLRETAALCGGYRCGAGIDVAVGC